MNDNTIDIRCTTVIDQRRYEFTISVPRALWAGAEEQWRNEFLDTCRLRCAAQIQREAGVALTDEQTARISAVPPGVADSPVAQLVTVVLFGGPLDGESVAVDPDDPEPGIGIIAAGCSYPGGRSWYEPDAEGRWVWKHDIPWGQL
ncbi:hypothetical protein [[Kitasatospora] papulosa]|uniref:hypothetical protein n=1 Tax=[Kitasatospora] papulosa TaxID=1464011 RepID=UPI00363C80D5